MTDIPKDIQEILKDVNDNEKELEVLKDSETSEAKAKVTAEELFLRVRADGFPYQKYFVSEDGLYAKVCKTRDQIVIGKKYQLRSYLPKGKSFLPPVYNLKGRSTYVYVVKSEESVIPNILTDLYVEDIRLQAKRKDQKDSTLEAFYDNKTLLEWCREFIKQGQDYTRFNFREFIWTQHSEASLFPISWARTIISFLFNGKTAGKNWVDISAGWGDRLIAAMSMKMNYIGFDPSTELKDRYDEIISKYGDPDHHRVFSEPFETQGWDHASADICFSSPPFLDIEIYPGKNQSIQNYIGKGPWLNSFMFRSLINLWRNIKVNGFLALHIGDSKMENTTFVEPTLLFIEENLPLSSYRGCIGVSGKAAMYIRPLWIFQKESARPFVSKSGSPRKLEDLYPGLLQPPEPGKPGLGFINMKKSPYFDLSGKIVIPEV